MTVSLFLAQCIFYTNSKSGSTIDNDGQSCLAPLWGFRATFKAQRWEVHSCLQTWGISPKSSTPNSNTPQFSSVQYSRSVVSDSLWPHELQHARPPCPSPTPGVHSNSCPSSQWCHPAISSSVVPFSSCPRSLPASGSFPMSQLFAWGGQSIGPQLHVYSGLNIF